MSFLWTLIIGLVVGAIAKLLMPGKDPGGFIVTMLIGVVGALLAGFLGRALGWYQSAYGHLATAGAGDRGGRRRPAPRRDRHASLAPGRGGDPRRRRDRRRRALVIDQVICQAARPLPRMTRFTV